MLTRGQGVGGASVDVDDIPENIRGRERDFVVDVGIWRDCDIDDAALQFL